METKNFKVVGASAGGVGTCLVAHPYKVALDIGFVTAEALACQTVLVSHTHIDHMGAAVQHAASRTLTGQSPSRFVCGPETAKALVSVLELWKTIQGGFEYTVVALEPGQELDLGKGLSVKTFPTFHRVSSTGFLLFETRRKLKPEFVGRPGVELGALRKQGVTLEDTVKTPVLAFTGDTTAEALDNPEVREALVLVAECSFVGDEVTVEKAREHGHTHLKELEPRLQGLKGTVVLFHFSLRHGREELEEALAGAKEALGDRLHLVLEGAGPVSAW